MSEVSGYLPSEVAFLLFSGSSGDIRYLNWLVENTAATRYPSTSRSPASL